MSWNTNPRKEVDLNRERNQELEPRLFSQISLELLVSHPCLFLHMLHSLFLQRRLFHFSVHIVENCHPLPIGSIMLPTRPRG